MNITALGLGLNPATLGTVALGLAGLAVIHTIYSRSHWQPEDSKPSLESSSIRSKLAPGPSPVVVEERVDSYGSGKVLRGELSAKVTHCIPKSENQQIQKNYNSFEEMCRAVAQERIGAGKINSKEVSKTSFSGVNRGNPKATFDRIPTSLQKALNLENADPDAINDALETTTIYAHNSDFNGRSYKRKDSSGKEHEEVVEHAIASSADRTAPNVQNLSAVHSKRKDLFYTGRPDTLNKAKEQAIFMLERKGLTIVSDETKVNCKAQNFPYVVYSLLGDSFAFDAKEKVESMLGKNEFSNERQFTIDELKALKELRKTPLKVQNSKGQVFELNLKPIMLSQSFNAFATFKGLAAEGATSSPIMENAWSELKQCIDFKYDNDIKGSKIEPHVKALENHIMGWNPFNRLSSTELTIHIAALLSELNNEKNGLPVVIHCKSSTDRTGILGAIMTSMEQWKECGNEIPAKAKDLINNETFKELFITNWLPMWHVRSEHSRDIKGISFGAELGQNPTVAKLVPERCLNNLYKNAFSPGFKPKAIAFGLALGSIPYFAVNFAFQLLGVAWALGALFTYRLPIFNEGLSILRNAVADLGQPAFLPSAYLNDDLIKEFASKGSPKTPLEKSSSIEDKD